MGKHTTISWCDHTFNPWFGCQKVSPGCAHCYAEVDAPARVARAAGTETWGLGSTRKIRAEGGWRDPVRWDREAAKAGVRRRVFSLSQGDWLEDRPDLVAPRARLLNLIEATPYLDWLLLTKRPENLWDAVTRTAAESPLAQKWAWGRPPENVWIGASVEDQRRLVERYDPLLSMPAALRFLSIEPLLGPVDLSGRLTGIDWVIVGGESGRKARPCDLRWIRDIVGQCRKANVPVFVKQLGSYRMGVTTALADHPIAVMTPGVPRVDRPIRDPKGGDPSEWPEDFRVREFPTIARTA